MLIAYRFQAEHDDNNLIEMSYWVIDALAKYYVDQGSSSVGQIVWSQLGTIFEIWGMKRGSALRRQSEQLVRNWETAFSKIYGKVKIRVKPRLNNLANCQSDVHYQ